MVPQPVYELLPYLYMLIGLFGVISLESGWGKLSGLILIATGIVVQQLRARHRAHNQLFSKLNRAKSAGDPTSRRPGEDPPSRRSGAEPTSRRSMPEPRSRRSMPEPRSKRV